jgi:hypothetical protein
LNPANAPLEKFGWHFGFSAIALTLPLIPLAIAQGYMWLDYRVRKQLNQQICPDATTPDRFACIRPRHLCNWSMAICRWYWAVIWRII